MATRRRQAVGETSLEGGLLPGLALRRLLFWAAAAICFESVSAVHSSSSSLSSTLVSSSSSSLLSSSSWELGLPEAPASSSLLEDSEEATANLSGASALGLRQGDSFLQRFQLLEHLGSSRLAVAPGFFPEVLKDEFKKTSLLGHGGFGESWLAYDQNLHQRMVVKVLYIKTKDPKDTRHLTWELAKGDSHLKTAAEHAASECDMARQFHLQKEHPGSRRIMNCYGHNIPSGSSSGLIEQQHKAKSEPLFLMLEDCGKLQLDDFLHEAAQKDSVPVDLPGRAFKQVLQGLSLLASYDPPYVHHDVKPQNLIVRRDPKGKFSVHIIDFGETVRGSAKDQCERTASSTRYAPTDWYHKTPDCKRVANFNVSCGARCASAYDVFSAGATFVELISGKGLYTMKGCSYRDSKGKTRLDYTKVDDLAHRPSALVESLESHSGFEDTVQHFSEPGSQARHFLEHAARCLHKDPSARPTAAELLDTPYMRSLDEDEEDEAVHDDPDRDGDGTVQLAVSPQGRFSRLRERHHRSG